MGFIGKILFGRKNNEVTKEISGLPDVNGQVNKDMLELALDFLISLEPDPELPNAMEIYDRKCEKHQKEIDKARKIIRWYGEQIEPKSLEFMQEKFYEITNSSKYRQSAIHCSVVYSTLNSVWNGIGPWRA